MVTELARANLRYFVLYLEAVMGTELAIANLCYFAHVLYLEAVMVTE